MKIEIGEYVRTKSGFIGKVITRHGGYGLHYELNIKKEIQNNMMNGIVREDNIVKHSKHIIDLIEVGDYVNGKYVKEINQYKNGKSIIALIGIIDEQDIKTIVTKEQFNLAEYRLEE